MKLDFKKNLGDTDRVIRTGVALLLAGLAFTGVFTGVWANLAIIMALFQFVEAALGY
ncbi:MAG: YgaP family membrane protein [Dethiobacteria bacterium]